MHLSLLCNNNNNKRIFNYLPTLQVWILVIERAPMKAHSITGLFFFWLAYGGESRLGDINCKRGDGCRLKINLTIFIISIKTQNYFLTYNEMNSATACEFYSTCKFYLHRI